MTHAYHAMYKDPKVTPDDRTHNGGGKDINIIVVGGPGVGKTAITVRYLTRRFIGDYDSGGEAMYTHTAVVDGKAVTLHILDTTWQEDSLDGRTDEILWADGMMLVYSITDSDSLDRLRTIADRVLSVRANDKLVLALVANKCDLLHRKHVSDTSAAQFCAEYNCIFFETSASDSFVDVESAFSSVSRHIKAVYKKREKLSKFLQNPAVTAKLQIRNSLRNFAEKKLRRRTSTM
ncbi:ras-related and estrogen-regulated growth inhibitor-like [Mizuhopecten yessoensis]|uniref:small monomeric GTPase n=1 Tax=Mizuhopecten yessoensis TaxID=6573 RepID=A0A210QFW8_MIZYE|nr:ras-related and estrogen-regulated growth inhibitor-like [Mizuhopecten yessoensis]OWF47511.1 Ras-like protein family member 11B [Mizuhopecten yessoensis]